MKMRRETKLIVIHRGEVFNETEYHHVVHPGGRIQDCVPFLNVGAHARLANGYSVGICVFGNFAHLERSHHPAPDEDQIASAADLVRWHRWWNGFRVPIAGHSSLGAIGTSFPDKLVPGHDCPGTRGDLMGRLKLALGDP